MVSVVAVVAFLYEIVNTSLGQGYGTLGSPTFLLLGFSPKMVVPSILLSQAVGAFVSVFFHNKWRNADFSNHQTGDMKKVYTIVGTGVIGVVAASILGFKLPSEIISLYIGLMVTTI